MNWIVNCELLKYYPIQKFHFAFLFSLNRPFFFISFFSDGLLHTKKKYCNYVTQYSSINMYALGNLPLTVVCIKYTIIVCLLLQNKWVPWNERHLCIYIYMFRFISLLCSHLFVNTCPYSFDNIHSLTLSQAIKST